MRQALPFALLCFFFGTAAAAEMRSVDVEYENSRYTMQSVAWFDAPREQVYEVFSDWDLSTEFSSVVVESRDLPPDEHGRPQFFVRNRGCLLFFCLTFERRGHVERQPLSVLRAVANPETSDFLLSDETWTFSAEDEGTVVVYRLLMQPKFWVPPGIGPYIIKRKLKRDGGDALDRIEAIARRRALDKGPQGE